MTPIPPTVTYVQLEDRVRELETAIAYLHTLVDQTDPRDLIGSLLTAVELQEMPSVTLDWDKEYALRALYRELLTIAPK